jgi:hypothetical protein
MRYDWIGAIVYTTKQFGIEQETGHSRQGGARAQVTVADSIKSTHIERLWLKSSIEPEKASFLLIAKSSIEKYAPPNRFSMVLFPDQFSTPSAWKEMRYSVVLGNLKSETIDMKHGEVFIPNEAISNFGISVDNESVEIFCDQEREPIFKAAIVKKDMKICFGIEVNLNPTSEPQELEFHDIVIYKTPVIP